MPYAIILVMVYFTSDHHFGHRNILGYCHREFADIGEHDRALIEEWNAVVKPGDDIYHLGDFTLMGKSDAERILYQLKGNIHVLCTPWHHDRQWLAKKPELENVDYLDSVQVLSLEGYTIVLCHYPFEVWDRRHYGSFHFHGHSHGNLARIANRLDVGVDNAYRLLGRYRPFELSEAIRFASDML
jgi:calcineurin-like phosphoesterase family protein